MVLVRIPTSRIVDWESFHDVFAEVFGFPDWYGRNMNAWIDCLSDLDDPETTLCSKNAAAGESFVLHVEDGNEFSQRCPEQYLAILECAAYINWRRVDRGENAILLISCC